MISAALASGLYFVFPRDPTFEEAKKYPEKRQAYIEAVEKKFKLDGLPYVEDVFYNNIKVERNVQSPLEGESAMRTVLTGRKPGEEYDIEIYDAAFNPDFSEPDFLSCLIDHEIEGHARPYHHSFSDIGGVEDSMFTKEDGKKFNEKLEYTVFELYAYTVQIKKLRERNVDTKFNNFIWSSYWEHYSDIIHPGAEKGLKEPGNLKRFRELFFVPELLKLMVSIKEFYTGPAISPDGGKIMTTYGPVELPDYLKEKVEEWRGE